MLSNSSSIAVGALRDVMRDLFLEELRIDQGWSEYIDLLLESVDLTALAYTQTNGMRFSIRFDEYASLYSAAHSCISSYRGSDSTGDFTLYVVNPYVSDSTHTYYDYTDCRIRSGVQTVAYTDSPAQGGALQESSFYQCWLYVPSGAEVIGGDVVLSQPWRDTGVSPVALWTDRESLGLSWSRIVDLYSTVDPVLGDSLPCTFMVVVYDELHTDAGDVLLDYTTGAGVPVSCAGPCVELARVPQQLNLSAIYSARYGSGAGVTLNGIKPNMAGFWSIVTGLGFTNDSPIPYRFHYYSGVDRGISIRDYPSEETLGYVDFRGQVDATASAVDGGNYLSPAQTADYVGVIAAAPTPLVSCVWDRWGVLSTTEILGYDKKYWVVRSNRSASDIDVLYIGGVSGDSVTWGDSGVYPDGLGVSFSPLVVSLGQQAQDSYSGVSAYGAGSIALTRVSPETVVDSSVTDYPTLGDFNTATLGDGFIVGTPAGIPIVAPNSVLGYNDYGLHKDVHLLSYLDSKVDRIVLSFGCLKQVFAGWLVDHGFIASVEDVNSYIDWLEALLQKSAPVGITVQVSFEMIDMPVPLGVYASSESVTLYIEVTPESGSVDDSGGSVSVSVSANVPWQVTGEVGPYIRVQLPDGTWGESTGVSFDGIQSGSPTEDVNVDSNRVIASVTQED